MLSEGKKIVSGIYLECCRWNLLFSPSLEI